MTSRCQHGLPSSDWGHRLSHGPHLTGRATAGSSPTLDGHWIGPALGRDGSLSATCPSCRSEAAQGLHCTRPCAEDELPCPELSLDLSVGCGDLRPSAELARPGPGSRPTELPGASGPCGFRGRGSSLVAQVTRAVGSHGPGRRWRLPTSLSSALGVRGRGDTMLLSWGVVVRRGLSVPRASGRMPGPPPGSGSPQRGRAAADGS